MAQLRTQCCLDFDWQELATSLNYEVYFLAYCGTPVAELCPLDAGVAGTGILLQPSFAGARSQGTTSTPSIA